MIAQNTTEEATKGLPPVKRLTPQELERITQPYWEASKAEVSAYWRKRFLDKQLEQQQTQPVE